MREARRAGSVYRGDGEGAGGENEEKKRDGEWRENGGKGGERRRGEEYTPHVLPYTSFTFIYLYVPQIPSIYHHIPHIL